MQPLIDRMIISTFMMFACTVLFSCSPYVYSSDIAKLSTVTSSIDASYQQTERSITDQQYQNNRYKWMQQRSALTIGPGCNLDNTGREKCQIISGAGGTAAATLRDTPKPVSPAKSTDVCDMPSSSMPVNVTLSDRKEQPTSAPEIADLLRVLDNYVSSLAAVTKAQDRADFDAAAGKLSTAVGALAQSGGPYGAAAAPIAKASINIALWFVGEALDSQRLEVLRNNTRAACQPIHVVTHALGLALENERGRLLSAVYVWNIDMVQKYNMDRVNPRVSDQTLGTDIENAQAAVAKFEAVRVSDPKATMRALSDTHDALVVAVRDDKDEFGALVTSLQTLSTQAQALAVAAAPPAKKS